ncbi:amidohydrolase family protein [Hyphococcus sp.]|uniref:amidohydrolase family protein n=1 Tax=Hyphococcus sp. TaxID=2038636 RepID=UPI003CCB969E
MKAFLTIVSSILIVFAHASAEEDYEARGLAIANVHILPMTADEVRYDQTILLADGKVVMYGDADTLEIPETFETLNGLGQFVMPGLSDMHVHLRETDQGSLGRYLKAGVTQIREMNGRPFLLEWKNKIERGELDGPRMIVASPSIGNFSSPREGYETPETVEEAEASVASFQQDGYDLIKIHNFVPPDIFAAIVRSGRELNMPVAGHVPVVVSLNEALSAGLRSIEHMTGVFETVATEDGLAMDEKDFSGAYFGAPISKKKLNQAAKTLASADIYLTASLVWFTKQLAFPPAEAAFSDIDRRRLGLENRLAAVRAFQKAGVNMMMGTDSDGGGKLAATAIHEELALMTQAGLTPFEALRTATVVPAQYLGRSGDGVIEKGARADLILLACNPLERIACVSYINGVVRDGEIVYWSHDSRRRHINRE